MGSINGAGSLRIWTGYALTLTFGGCLSGCSECIGRCSSMYWWGPSASHASCSASKARGSWVSGRGLIDLSWDVCSLRLLLGSTWFGAGCRAGFGLSGAGRCVGTHNVLRLQRGSLASPRGSLQTRYAALIKQLMCLCDHCGRCVLVGLSTLAIVLAEPGSQPG